MLDFLKFKSTPLVGIDIGSVSIKLLELQKHSNRYYIANGSYCDHALPPVIEQMDPSQLIKNIHTVIKNSGTRCRYASLSIRGTDSMLHRVSVDKTLNENEIIEYLHSILDQTLPFDIEDGYYDFQIIGPSNTNPNLNDILLAVAKNTTVDFYVNAIAMAGLKVTKVDIASLALYRAYLFASRALSLTSDKFIAFIDIGATQMTLQIIQNEQLVYLKEERLKAPHLTKEFINQHLTSLPVVKEINQACLKRELSILDKNDSIFLFIQEITNTIQQILNTFHSANSNTVQHIILVGGWSFYETFRLYLQSQLGINILKTSVAQIFQSLTLPEAHYPFFQGSQNICFMHSLGLALRTFDECHD